MKVLYDAEILGSIHKRRMPRTGLFRVVEEVAKGLGRSRECELIFCASATYDGSRSYLASTKEFEGIPLSDPVPDRMIPAILRNLEDSIQYRKSSRDLPLRMVRKALTGTAKLTGDWAAMHRVAHPSDLETADIYHSGYYAFPDETRGHSNLRRFLTVFDLIPILHPEFVGGVTDHILRRILDCLEPSDWVLAISESAKQDLCAYKKFDPSRVFVTPLAANATWFYPSRDAAVNAEVRARYGIPNAPYLLSLSTLEPRKNIDHVIRSFARLVAQQKLEDLHLVLVGAEGWDFDAIFEAREHETDVRNRVIFTGYVPNEDLAMLYSGALAFVFMSLYEGFGLPPLEAMQCGAPVITSNNSSLPEVVGDAGIMLDARDADGLCQALLNLYNDQELRAEMSGKSLQRAALFSWKRCVELTLDAYRTALR
jgi:glycosyltransferase involved in cell wall biosynthesis